MLPLSLRWSDTAVDWTSNMDQRKLAKNLLKKIFLNSTQSISNLVSKSLFSVDYKNIIK